MAGKIVSMNKAAEKMISRYQQLESPYREIFEGKILGTLSLQYQNHPAELLKAVMGLLDNEHRDALQYAIDDMIARQDADKHKVKTFKVV